ncbi:hypothetical protein KIH87_01035 [Paraneptunicella aestuarii]|uniref:hypothetical protein n=1 Tax=Paraneptunicella aestuarii TaxID=2831148 RepID=UPI001E53EFE6|nr:hypothetical protein [Paraneptunicella aestuarii]UAA38986.1 hypothetical protein KIH87_01035 [Paraneptunicella aestuarii]
MKSIGESVMVNIRKLFFMAFGGLALLLGCVQVSAQEELTDGPGLFTGKTGELTLYQSNQNGFEATSHESANTGAKEELSSREEFELYKRWQYAKQNNTKDYGEFMQWLEFQRVIKVEK